MAYVPTGRPRGRPPGAKNKTVRQDKLLAQALVEGAFDVIQELAGLKKVPVFDEVTGKPIMEQVFNDDGSPKLSDTGEPVFQPKMRKLPGSPVESVRLGAATTIIERAFGKPVQALANDEENPITQVTKVEHEIVPVGTPLNDDAPPDDYFDEEEDKKIA